MDTPIRKMTPAEAERYREQYRKATRQAGPERFRHFATPEQQAQHQQQVREAQEAGAPF